MIIPKHTETPTWEGATRSWTVPQHAAMGMLGPLLITGLSLDKVVDAADLRGNANRPTTCILKN